jgi:DNA-binding NarL/FixJ family response regulator
LRLDRNPLSRRPHFHPLLQFTQRKNEVLRWMVEGKRNAEIGINLNISSRTVEKHVEEILAELGVEKSRERHPAHHGTSRTAGLVERPGPSRRRVA